MQINVIHLSPRSDRKVLLDKVIEENNLDVKFWEGEIDLRIPFRGIARAHKKIVHHAQHAKLPRVLIGEDDLYFPAPGAFEYFLENIPEDYDLYLASVYHGKIDPVDHTTQDFAGLTLYMVHERFYQAFLDAPDNVHFDRALKGRGKFVVCEPFTALQRHTYSDNHKSPRSYDHLLKGRKIFGK